MDIVLLTSKFPGSLQFRDFRAVRGQRLVPKSDRPKAVIWVAGQRQLDRLQSGFDIIFFRSITMAELLFKDECYQIQGAIFEVYREMGCGFLEPVYQECLEMEFRLRNIPFVPQSELLIQYKQKPLKQTYKSDFICFGTIIVELKALSALITRHEAQVLNYLKATGYRVGLLVNFGDHPKATIKRLVR